MKQTFILSLIGMFSVQPCWAGMRSPSTCKGAVARSAKVQEYSIPQIKSRDLKKACGENSTCRITKLNRDGSEGETYIKQAFEAATPISDTPCKYGKGLNEFCLNPCETIAADLDKYDNGNAVFNIGDVLYFPELKGAECADGTFNGNGLFVIVADSQKSRGKDQFELFLGACKNPGKNGCDDHGLNKVKKAISAVKLNYCYIGNISADETLAALEN